MKRIHLRVFVAMVIFVVLASQLIGCVKLNETEEEIVGKYELIEVSIEGYPQVTVDSYEYFTIEFFSNKKCNVKSKAGSTEYDVDAEWKSTLDGEVEVVTKQGLAKTTEKYTYEDGILSGTNSTVINGSSISMTVKMQKIVESTEE